MSDTKTEAQRSSLEVAQEHALILTQALPWVKALAGKTIVIKYGGAAMVDETLRASVMEDIMLMKLVGAVPSSCTAAARTSPPSWRSWACPSSSRTACA